MQWRRPGLLLAAVVAVLLGVGAATRLGLDAGPGPDGGSVPDGGSPPSSTRGTGGKVAEHDEGEGWNLYVAEVASGRIARLTDVESEAPIFADWSPDGRAIAFSRPRCEECPGQLWTMSRRGTRARRLGPATGAVTGVSWSPHGRRIAAAITRRGLVVVSPATGVLRPLTRTRTQDDAPAWGPAGEVAFARRSSRGGWDLWTVTAGGGAPRRLVAGPDQEVEPAWSRDGTRLVYQQEARGGQWTLWTARRDGSGRQALTLPPRSRVQPAWAPDGRRLAFVGVTLATSRVGVLDRRTRRTRVLTPARLLAAQPAWSPDGRSLLFTARPVRKAE